MNAAIAFRYRHVSETPGASENRVRKDSRRPYQDPKQASLAKKAQPLGVILAKELGKLARLPRRRVGPGV